MRTGQPLPDRIANAPQLRTGLQLYLEAFFDLDSQRNHGFGVSNIPFLYIIDYAKAFEFDDEQTSDLVYLIRRMDGEHCKRLAEKAKTNG